MEHLLRLFDIYAGAFCNLVSDVEHQNAFIAMLDDFVRRLSEQFTGHYYVVAPMASLPAAAKPFRERLRYWTTEGYRRIQNLTATPEGSESEDSEARLRIDEFIRAVRLEGTKITRTDIWTVAGYSDATEFERFQRGDQKATT